MFAALLVALATAAPDDKKRDDLVPVFKELFAAEPWYKDQKGKEEGFVGVLVFKNRPKGVVGFGRFNPFTLTLDDGKKKSVREVYVGNKPELLKPYAGMKVKLTGKAVDMEVEGRMHHEIWPARIEVLPDDKKGSRSGDKPDRIRELRRLREVKAKEYAVKQAEREHTRQLHCGTVEELPGARTPEAQKALQQRIDELAAKLRRQDKELAQVKAELDKIDAELKKDDKKPEGKELKVLARATWAPAGRSTAQQRVIRSAEELALASGQTAERAKDEAVQKQITAAVAKQFKVKSIDWTKQMVVAITVGSKPTGGYSVEVLGLTVKDKALTVRWKLNSPAPGDIVTQVISFPVQAVLAERFDGDKITFDPPAKKEKKD
jgi:hypothetical protein